MFENSQLPVICVDIGGTKTRFAIMSQHNKLNHVQIISTPKGNEGKDLLSALHKNIDLLLQSTKEQIVAIGVGSAGRIDSVNGKVLFATDNLPGWTNMPIKKKLENYHGIPVFVDNDVNVAAIGETATLSKQSNNHFLFLAIGTGVGGALIHKDEPISGYKGGSGELGHMILYPDGRECNCGQRGCLEQYVSGTALNRLAQSVGENWDSYRLMEEFQNGHVNAVEIMDVFIKDLATGLISLQNIYAPEQIVLGGGIAKTYPLWRNILQDKLRKLSPREIFIEQSVHKEDAGLIGAGILALKETEKWRESDENKY